MTVQGTSSRTLNPSQGSSQSSEIKNMQKTWNLDSSCEALAAVLWLKL